MNENYPELEQMSEFFREMTIDSIRTDERYREQHDEILKPFTEEEAQATVDLYLEIEGKALKAAQHAKKYHADLLVLLLESEDRTLTSAIETVIFKTLEMDNPEEEFHLSHIYWMRRWLQETKPAFIFDSL